MIKNRTVQLTVIALVFFAIAGLAYFGHLTRRYTQQPEGGLPEIQTSVGSSEETAPAGQAQFKADCAGNGGRIMGIVSVPQAQDPSMLSIVDVKTDDGTTLRLDRRHVQCSFAPY